MSDLAEEIKNQMKTKKEPTEVIEIRHVDERGAEPSDLQAQLDAEKKKNENLSLIIEAEAIHDFEIKKSNLLKNVPEARREKISDFIGEDSEKMAQIQASLIISGQDLEDFYDDNVQPQKSPSGKVGMLPQNEGRQTGRVSYTNPVIQQYSDLYGILRSPTSSAESKAEAEQLLDDAFVEIGKGLRSRSRNNPYSLPRGVVTHCFFCGGIVEADLGKGIPCPHCKFRFGIDKFPRNPKFQPR